MAIYFWNGAILIRGGAIAMHERCCCGRMSYLVGALLDWNGSPDPAPPEARPDLDLYIRGGDLANDPFIWESTCYYSGRSGSGFSLDHDAYPGCSDSAPPPEISVGSFTRARKFSAWYTQHSDCAPSAGPSDSFVRVVNTGTVPLDVNGTKVMPDPGVSDPSKWWEHHGLPSAGYDTGAVPSFGGGYEFTVKLWTPTP